MCARTTWPTEIKLCIVRHVKACFVTSVMLSISNAHRSPCCTIRSRANKLCKIVCFGRTCSTVEREPAPATYGTPTYSAKYDAEQPDSHGNQTMLGVNSNKSHHSPLYRYLHTVWPRRMPTRDPLAVANLLIWLHVSWLQFTCTCKCCPCNLECN